MGKLVLVLTVVVVLAACGSSGKKAATTTTASTTTTTVAPTTTTVGLTVSQVASVVAGERSDLLNYIGSVTDNCLPICNETGSLDEFTLGITAKTLIYELNAATKNKTVPAEISGLLGDTLTALQATGDASDTYLKCQKGGAATGTCTEAQADPLGLAALDLKDKLDSWDPYI